MLKVYLSFVVQDIVSFPNQPSLNDLANPAFRSSGVDSPRFTWSLLEPFPMLANIFPLRCV